MDDINTVDGAKAALLDCLEALALLSEGGFSTDTVPVAAIIERADAARATLTVFAKVKQHEKWLATFTGEQS